MPEITYTRGDATTPSVKGVKVIAHVCNDSGGWGKGFVLSLSRRWPQPEAAYRAWHRIDAALERLAVPVRDLGASVHMPRIGCGLAGGAWPRVEPLIAERLVREGIAVTVYDQGEGLR
ncbi:MULTISPECIES: Appr-1-p processing protein [unclassified Streptomyces]|uniref:Appr-1-p processing protein n=1 Tax=unclassified Streptomyces TaxID=2593676 RepID=UPI000DDC00E7|nr:MULTISPECIES: Appr-1-p processing protein [unclassified Streptomyces]QZZ31352.1 Appr-1-p processing protein [Streptomyces sp. ST1015]